LGILDILNNNELDLNILKYYYNILWIFQIERTH